MKFDLTFLLTKVVSFLSVLEEITLTLFWSAFIFLVASLIVLFFTWVFSR